ncbi:MAG: DUF4878 domain-containing protein [Bacteroidota bacterium]|nr:DUF4878 domain-containing protein [Bacteroidota bacterium]
MIHSIRNTVYALSILVIVATACNSGNSPKNAASKFLNAFNEKNYEEARKYATPETIKLVDLMENLSKMSTSIDSVPHNKIVVTEEKIDGETATVTFNEVGSTDSEEVHLKKVDGKWLVHITKADITAKENTVFDTGEEGLMQETDDLEEFEVDSISTGPAN